MANDSPPIIGEIYREFAEYCYKQNLLIKNKLRIEGAESNNDSGCQFKEYQCAIP